MARIRTIRGVVEKRRTEATPWLLNGRAAVLAEPPHAARDEPKAADADELATLVLSDVIASVNQSVSQF